LATARNGCPFEVLGLLNKVLKACSGCSHLLFPGQVDCTASLCLLQLPHSKEDVDTITNMLCRSKLESSYLQHTDLGL